MRSNAKTVVLFVWLIVTICVSPAFCGQETMDQKKDYLQKISQEASNPMGELWMLTNQFNLNVEQAPQSKLFQRPRPQWNYTFEPVLKFDLNSEWRLVTRPLLPLYASPTPTGRRPDQYTSGLGDMELKGVLGPIMKGSGFRWGVGPTAVFPTAADTRLGNGKWQLGVAMAALYMNEKWVVGVLPEHWWSVAGDANRQDISLTKTQYFLWYSPAPTWQVGMSPTVCIDWTQKKSEDAVTLPVGLGVSKTVMLGHTPVKFGLEVDYAVVRPRRVTSDEWSVKLSIIPIIPQLF